MSEVLILAKYFYLTNLNDWLRNSTKYMGYSVRSTTCQPNNAKNHVEPYLVGNIVLKVFWLSLQEKETAQLAHRHV